MPEMESKTNEKKEKNMEARDIDVANDALNNSKRVQRSFFVNYPVEHSSREDDLVEEIDISSSDRGMRRWKPMNGHRGKFDKFAKGNSSNLSWQPRSSSFTSNSLEDGYSSMAQKRVGNVNGKNEVIISPDGRNSFPFHRSDMRKKGKEIESKSNHRQNFPVRGLSISNGSMMRQREEITISSNKDKGVYSYADEFLSNPSYRSSYGIHTGQAKAISKENVEKRVYIDLSEGGSSHELNPIHTHFDEKKKRKLNLEDETARDMQHGESTIQSSRATSLFGKEVASIAEEQRSPFQFGQNFGWQKAHNIKLNTNQLSHAFPSNHKEKLSSFYLPEWRHETKIEDQNHGHVICKSSHITISNQFHDQAYPDPVLSRRNHSWKQYAKGKKKGNSLLPLGETSDLFLNQPSYPQSHAETSNFNHDTSLMEIDKHCPDERCYSSNWKQNGASDSSIASASQIESDEAFARELQKQFYHETTRFISMEKVDETIAWSLQQDEDAKAAALFRRGHSNSEFCEIASKFDDEVDLETRLDLLEAVGDLVENNVLQSDDTTSNDSTSNDSLNDSDHEMLSNLDASHRFGSSEINNLPLSLIQNDNNKEACAICLEIPSVGETMRHLPCLHKFHKMCIDIWLKKRPSCPMCKFKIT